MQKTYWWRVATSLTSCVLLIVSYIFGHKILFSLCDKIGLDICFETTSQTIGKPLFLLSLSLLIVSIFIFFITDIVFKKWLRFAIVWFVVAAVFVALAPVYSGGYIGLNPTKESISIWMGSLFVILSLIQIVWQSRKLQKN